MAIQVADEQINNSKDDHEFWRLELNLALYHLISGNNAKADEIYRKAIAQSPPQTLRNGINDLPLSVIPQYIVKTILNINNRITISTS